MGIMYMRTILKFFGIHRGKIILFSKGCPNPSFPLCVVAAAPAQATVALTRRQPPCQGVATPTAGVATPSSGRAGRDGSPLRTPYSRPPLLAQRCKRVCPRAAVAAAGCCPRERRRPPMRAGPGRCRSPPSRGPWSLPGRRWPARHGPWLPLLLATFTVKI
ncbi:hypothetical protein GW17_00017252 [Ensete ventricosum]|nr:hypothetical protein GW17_00017252 [Ensete ventricosum]RZS23410.1 hypothetical protein BHM03_00056338 [Ensete ventricosum]